MSDDELELRKRFAELRAEDEATAPAYANLRGRALEEANRPVRRLRWIAPTFLAAAAAVVATVWVMTRQPDHEARKQQEDASLGNSMNAVNWTMPTDGLLTSARRTLQTPALFGSVLDAAAVPIRGTPFKGD